MGESYRTYCPQDSTRAIRGADYGVTMLTHRAASTLRQSLLVPLLLLTGIPVQGSSPEPALAPAHARDRVIVGFTPAAGPRQRRQALGSVRVASSRSVSPVAPGVSVVELRPGQAVGRVIRKLEARGRRRLCRARLPRVAGRHTRRPALPRRQPVGHVRRRDRSACQCLGFRRGGGLGSWDRGLCRSPCRDPRRGHPHRSRRTRGQRLAEPVRDRRRHR